MTEQVEGRQRQILEFLRSHARQHSYPPTVREIGHAVGLSSSTTVQNHLNALETKGLIRRNRASDDRRLVYLELTDEGNRAYPRMREISMSVVNRFLRGFSQTEARQLEGYLTRMLENAT
jgi:DNA-binding MarR family transcriptional regulator